MNRLGLGRKGMGLVRMVVVVLKVYNIFLPGYRAPRGDNANPVTTNTVIFPSWSWSFSLLLLTLELVRILQCRGFNDLSSTSIILINRLVVYLGIDLSSLIFTWSLNVETGLFSQGLSNFQFLQENRFAETFCTLTITDALAMSASKRPF